MFVKEAPGVSLFFISYTQYLINIEHILSIHGWQITWTRTKNAVGSFHVVTPRTQSVPSLPFITYCIKSNIHIRSQSNISASSWPFYHLHTRACDCNESTAHHCNGPLCVPWTFGQHSTPVTHIPQCTSPIPNVLWDLCDGSLATKSKRSYHYRY